MKKALKIAGAAMSILIILAISAFFIIRSMDVPEVEVMDVDLRHISDGIYTGEYAAGPVKAVVMVQVENNRITDITIVQHKNGLGRKAEKIVEEIINKQSLNVEVVSGATLSSNVIRKAVEKALAK